MSSDQSHRHLSAADSMHADALPDEMVHYFYSCFPQEIKTDSETRFSLGAFCATSPLCSFDDVFVEPRSGWAE